MKNGSNIDLWSVRPAGLTPAEGAAAVSYTANSGVQLPWAHRGEPYVSIVRLGSL
jgi:hypothetical protein